MTNKQKNIALGVGGTALVAAVAAIVFLVLSGGDENDESSSASGHVEQLELATDETNLITRVSGLGTDAAVSPGDYEKAVVRAETMQARARAGGGDPVAAQSLAGAARSVATASSKLARVEAARREAVETLDSEEVASEEASTRLASLADEVDAVGADGEAARRDLRRALLQVRTAVRAIREGLETEGQLESDAAAALAGANARIANLRARIDRNLALTQARLDELSSDLASRSVELEPDLVLDCPEIVPDGAGVYGVSVRNMSCAEAAALLGAFGPPAGFACTELNSGYEFTEYRCTSGDRAIRYGVGA